MGSLSLVCSGLVSVSVRPERLGVAGTARDTGTPRPLGAEEIRGWPARHGVGPGGDRAVARFHQFGRSSRAGGYARFSDIEIDSTCGEQAVLTVLLAYPDQAHQQGR